MDINELETVSIIIIVAGLGSGVTEELIFVCICKKKKQISIEVRDLRSDQTAMFMIESRKERSPSEFKHTEGPFGAADPYFERSQNTFSMGNSTAYLSDFFVVLFICPGGKGCDKRKAAGMWRPWPEDKEWTATPKLKRRGSEVRKQCQRKHAGSRNWKSWWDCIMAKLKKPSQNSWVV